ncbi:MAG TPA: M1 family aminopeptidase [Paucimonas sp.]|nr:M1 family aminopeptidase [Paucimonas sp.]
MRRLFCRHVANAVMLFATYLIALATHAAPVPTPPAMRLGDAVKPLAYDAELTIVPERDKFEGRIAIDIEIAREQDFYWINASRLDIRQASMTAGGITTNVEIVPGDDDFVGLRLPAKAAAGRARLVFEYSGVLSRTETRGLFKQRDGGGWYVFSQFEALHARQAFPCFDEPHWKTPWTLALTVRRDHVAVSNMPETGVEDVGADMKRVRFAPTAPLPSYLIALGVGPFDVVDGGFAGRNQTRMRYITPKDRGAEAEYAVKVTPQLLALLEDYFGRPYPFAKLDSLVIPVTVSFSAMENAGLITYNANTMLATPERNNERFQQRYASIAAHELAHQWFGDLVTMQWWNDLWLNESFATWMARKTIKQFKPEWDTEAHRKRERAHAMHIDRLASARQVRQPINVPDDLANAFDGITYSKGGAVLTMFETWLGEEAFRDGVRRYINRHEYGNATAEDFFAALSELDPKLAKGFSSFVEQPGVPRVGMTLQCEGKPTLRLTQERFLPAKPEAGPAQSWTIPVCVRYEGQKSDRPQCMLLSSKEAEWPLPDAAACPGWLLANPAGTGYFLPAPDASLVLQLPYRKLSGSEAAALAADLHLLAESASFPIDRVMDMAARYARDPRPEVVKAAVDAVDGIRTEWLSATERSKLARWIARHFGARAAQLGWLPRESESDATRSLRKVLLPLVASKGADRKLRAEARALAMKWLANKDKPPVGAMLGPILQTAAFSGDETVFDALAAAVSASRDAGLRHEMFSALGAFENPRLRQRAFELTLSERFDIREAAEILDAASKVPRHAPAVHAFIRERYDALAARLPEHYGARFAHWGKSLCSAQDRSALQQFFGGRIAGLKGGARNLAQALETIDICLASQSVQQERLKRFLAAAK